MAKDLSWARWDPAGVEDPSTMLSHSNSVFTRPSVANTVHGVRGAAPLPPNAAWVVKVDRTGTHASVGVALGSAALAAPSYGFLFGQSAPADSWVLCFRVEAGSNFLASSGGVHRPLSSQPNNLGSHSLTLKLRLEAGRKLFIILPGSAEQLLFDDLPQGSPLYAVGATVWGGGQVAIRPLGSADEEQEVEAQEQRAHQERLAQAEELLSKPRSAHLHSWKLSHICTRCHVCTGWGPSCVKVFGKDRSSDAGGLCGCGDGETGCENCGLCRACCKEEEEAYASAVAAAAGALRKLVPPTIKRADCCTGAPAGGAKPPAADTPQGDLPHFPSAFNYPTDPPRCLIELQLMKLAGAIRDKPRWTQKLQDPEIVARWKAEATAQGASEEMLKYVFEQLQYDATRQTFGTEGAVAGVFTADELVPDDLRKALLEQVARLEALPPDWHPGSDEQVLDLVHPSLFCLVYNVSKQLPEGSVTLDNCLALAGSGTTVAPPDKTGSGAPIYGWHYQGLTDQSTSTQWLPTNFQLDDAGAATPLSYINNVHPQKFKALYGVVARVLELLRPLFERALASSLQKKPLVIDPYAEEWYDEAEAPEYDDEAYDDWFENRQPKQPKVPATFSPPPETSAPTIDLRGRRLQVIVKLANIHLTPEKPRYNGGSWHVEGMRNERIVSTGIYYFDQDNVTDSHLAFRVSVEEPEYEQNDNNGVMGVFGLANEAALNQVLGQVTTLPGRCLCFPNIYQHQVQPFELKDKTRPGHRKILALFLVDPSQAVLSTSEIPPQQTEWWKEQVFADQKTLLGEMPPEVMDVVGNMVDVEPGTQCPFSLERAKEYREQLMKERSVFVDVQNEHHYEREFSLCEH